MKRGIVLFTISILAISCQSEKNQKAQLSPDWLEGEWQRTNDQEGNETFESWEKISEKEFSGVGFTLSEGDTIFKEYLRMVKTDSLWVYEVTGVNEQPTNFWISQIDSASFEAGNEANEFPKLIRYEKSSDGIRAIISNDSMKIGYDFVPMKP